MTDQEVIVKYCGSAEERSDLPYIERLKIYEQSKKLIPKDVSPKKYEYIIKQITKYLDI